jgi:hypothetical protein
MGDGLMGTGGGLERPKRRRRPCVQVEAEVEPTVNAVACRGLSCTSKRREQGPGHARRAEAGQADLGSLPSKRCVGPIPTSKHSTKAAKRR